MKISTSGILRNFPKCGEYKNTGLFIQRFLNLSLFQEAWNGTRFFAYELTKSPDSQRILSLFQDYSVIDILKKTS